MSASLRRDVLSFALVLVVFGVYQRSAGLDGEPYAVTGVVIAAATTLVSVMSWFAVSADEERDAE